MRFMIIVKSSKDDEAGVMPPKELMEELMNNMADYHEELAKAGVLLDGNGLQPSSKGWRIRWTGDRKTVIDGPFAETKELIAGYTLIKVNSREEAVEWANRFPKPQLEDCEIEIRQLYELEDFGEGPAVDRFREMGIATEK